jgi:nucleotide-binding universal stress UspA family protein
MSATILVPLDGSILAERALPYAQRLAEAAGGRLILTRIADPLRTFGIDVIEGERGAQASQYPERVAADLGGSGLAIETALACGRAAKEVLHQASSCEASLIVMATHGRSELGRWLHGSVADEVLRRSPVPIVLVHGDTHPWANNGPSTILVALDGSAVSEEVLGPAQTWARRLQAELVLLQVVAWPPDLHGEPGVPLVFDPEAEHNLAQEYLAGVAARLRGSVRCRAELARSPAAAIVQVAREEHASLVAMATHGRGGLARLVLGSVATRVVRRSRIPLLLVRPGMAQVQLAASVEQPESTVPAGGTVAVQLSQRDLDLILRGLGELLYKPAADLDLVTAINELRVRLKQVQLARGPATAAPTRP